MTVSKSVAPLTPKELTDLAERANEVLKEQGAEFVEADGHEYQFFTDVDPERIGPRMIKLAQKHLTKGEYRCCWTLRSSSSYEELFNDPAFFEMRMAGKAACKEIAEIAEDLSDDYFIVLPAKWANESYGMLTLLFKES